MKNFSFQNQDLVYEVPENSQIDSLAKGMLTNNNISGIAKTIFTQRNATQYIQFKIPSKVSVSKLFSDPVNRERLVKVFLSIVNTMLELEEYMLDYKMLVLDLDYIYVNISTEDITMIYMPISNDNREAADAREFFRKIICSVQFAKNEESNYVTQIINFLNNADSFSLLNFKKTLEDIKSSAKKYDNRNSNNDVNDADDCKKDTNVVNSPLNVSPKVVPIAHVKEEAEQMEIQTPPVKEERRKISTPPVKEKSKEEKKKSIWGAIIHPEKKEKVVKKTQNNDSVHCGVVIPGREEEIPSHKDGKENPPVDVSPSLVAEMDKKRENREKSAGYSIETDLDTTIYDDFVDDDEGTVVMDAQPKARKSNPYLIRAKTKEKIIIDKGIYRIGRNNEFTYNDYNIKGNLLIGHSHCYIIAQNGEYFVVDNNSKNHTCIDNRIIPANQETPIKHGQILRLADEEFEFLLN